MKIRSIRLNDVRRFTAPVLIDGIGDGINVICEPNEHGKSTIFDAVQALCFQPHRSQGKEVKALKPHVGGAPEVAMEVETAAGVFRLEKRWTSKPKAEVWEGRRLVAQADEAEEWIARLVGSGDGAPSGLLWVRQGATRFEDGSKGEKEAALTARRDLLSSVTGEVEAMTGGRRMDAALARCREELKTYATDTGRVRKGGPWHAAEVEVSALEAERARLQAIAEELSQALQRRAQIRRELSELEDPAAAADRREGLAAARRAFETAERHATEVERAREAADMARLRVEQTEADLERLRAALKEAAEAVRLADEAGAARVTAAEALTKAEAHLTDAWRTAKAASDTAVETDRALHAAVRRRAARDGEARRHELADRLVQVEALRRAAEEAAAAARIGPDVAALKRLEDLERTVASARALGEREAPHVVMTYEPGAEGGATLDGTPLADGTRTGIGEAAELHLRGLGRLTIHPGRGADDADLRTAERSLEQALADAGQPDMDAARTAAEARSYAKRRCSEAEAQLRVLAPDGIDALRTALAAIPHAEDSEDGPTIAEAEEAAGAATATRDAALRAAENAREANERAGKDDARVEAAAQAAAGRLERARAALGDSDPQARLAELEATLVRGRDGLAEAETRQHEIAAAAPDLKSAEAALRRAQSVVDSADRQIRDLTVEREGLEVRIGLHSGDAVEEELADTETRLAAARAQLERIAREVAVLRRLERALEGARAEARERYFEPVRRELVPLLRLLWPDAELHFDDRTLLPVAMTRNGQEEEVGILSGGTQEQVAMLVRLAFARLLAQGGRHAPVILDDALVFSDDDRIVRMFDALHRQAGDLQIIVLTCRQRAFRELGGRKLAFAADAMLAAAE